MQIEALLSSAYFALMNNFYKIQQNIIWGVMVIGKW